jgi:hypothetical protein
MLGVEDVVDKLEAVLELLESVHSEPVLRRVHGSTHVAHVECVVCRLEVEGSEG